ncbi:F-box/LRR-repeat protein, partial [Trifolium pratense]
MRRKDKHPLKEMETTMAIGLNSRFRLRKLTPRVCIQSNVLTNNHTSNNHTSQYDVDRFVNFAMQRGIENLNIIIGIKLPPSILSCKTLKVLKLERIMVNDLSQHQVNFPVLKTLHLKRVCFELHENLVKILSGCPMLEELKTKYLRVDSLVDSLVPKKELEGLLPNLFKATISYDSIIPVTFVRNVESLCLQV